LGEGLKSFGGTWELLTSNGSGMKKPSSGGGGGGGYQADRPARWCALR
jgi:hypothetical protein